MTAFADRQTAVVLLLIVGPLLTVALIAAGRRLARPFTAIRPGTCPRCGYDLRATPDRCPECGRTT